MLTCSFLFVFATKQKEAEKVKGDVKENNDEEMEIENGEKEVGGEAKA